MRRKRLVSFRKIRFIRYTAKERISLIRMLNSEFTKRNEEHYKIYLHIFIDFKFLV